MVRLAGRAAMERFVRLVVGGGLALVAGLWTLRAFVPADAPWLLGALLVVVGTGSLLAGIASELDVGWP